MNQSSNLVLKGKVAAVTGASSGIGQAIAENLGRAGAHVFMCGRKTESMQDSKHMIEEAGGQATLSAFDMRDVAAVQQFVTSAAAHANRLDIMVNNAGVGHPAAITAGDPENWREMLEVNVLGLLVGCQTAIRVMRETASQGHIVNISSVAALRRDSGVYGATKHAVNCINATLRQELEDDPIRVVSIMPGVFATNFARNFDPALVSGLAQAAGIEELAYDADGKLSRETFNRIQGTLSQVVGDVQQIAEAVRYVVTQPIEVNIEELVIRPAKSMNI